MKIKVQKREITLIVIISMVIVFFFSGFSLGKEFNKININANGEIAKPIVVVESDSPIQMQNIKEQGVYNFKVKNYDETNNITQVDMEYYIEILSPINENLSFKLYKEDSEISIQENKTETFLLEKNKKQEDNYRIEISCDTDKTIEEIIQELQIKVHSEQKKI